MLFDASSFNSAAFNSSGVAGYGDKPAMPAGVAVSGDVYILILTGLADGVADVTLPMTSIALRWTQGALAWMSVVVPDGLAFVDEIGLRPNGEIVVLSGEKWSNGWVVVSETLRAPLSLSRLDEGSFSNSYSLQGYSDMARNPSNLIAADDPNIIVWGGLPTNRPAEVRTPAGVTFRRGAAGAQELRAQMDTSIRIGDTMSHAAGSFVLRSLQWSISDLTNEILMLE